MTELKGDSPPRPLVGLTRRISSPATPSRSLPPGKSASAVVMPMRSLTSGGEYETKAQKETVNLGSSLDDAATILSPKSPKSPSLSLTSGVTRYQPLQERDEEEKEDLFGNSVIVNHHADSPSLESPGMEMDNRESENQKTKGSDLKAGSLRDKRLSDLVVKNREYRSPEPESVASESWPAFASDLVLRNEHSRDSLVSEFEEAANSVASSGAAGLQPESETQNPSYMYERESSPPRRPSPLHKSSSESNLATHHVQLDSHENCHSRKASIDTPSVGLHRVLSSGSHKAASAKPETVAVQVSVDTFSSSIIPQTSTGVISPLAQSPIRGSPLPRVPRLGRDGVTSPAGERRKLAGRSCLISSNSAVSMALQN